MSMLNHIISITAVKTTYGEMSKQKEAGEKYKPNEVVAYLNSNPQNAIVICDLDECSGECTAVGDKVAIFREDGAGLNQFQYQEFPLDEINANGGDLTAFEAVAKALDQLCT